MSTVNWSNSAVNTWSTCNRKYFFANILSSHGWKDLLKRKTYELKKMQNLTMWRGTVVDKFLEKFLVPLIVQKKLLNFEELAEQAVELGKAQFLFSQKKMYRDKNLVVGDADNEYCILDVHELNVPYTELQLLECYEDIRLGIRNVPLTKMPDGSLLIDFLKNAKVMTPNMQKLRANIHDASINPQIDLMLYDADWQPVVIDWKLSNSYVSDYSRQLQIAGLTVKMVRDKNPDKPPFTYGDIRLFEVNLYKGEVKEHPFEEEEINDLIDYIYLTSQDIKLLNDGKKEVNIDDFDYTESPATCANCTFKTLCYYMFTHNNQYDEKTYVEFIQNQEFSRA
ncbi:PD-(D/E)XK nuclease family protein [Mucilaginibacter sp. L3T2-6]|uniref:PD-(D/E)XK nuclease family protein n=1 Tax=Mucilaginibacter sp. L3T2-6 TaxID=3062491 RepID=UPI002674A508|nr:PD-(D/E)XK nuclease family protein [Mucilaginibacter sp. L3T2-6]MDO3641500.1 PD-(D/E)XK nuclease family protein [Mucilaginibacter sp. L3T2-6]MDV6213739.1 PD-(D/E)XK nuclease family protein [Mucilaginibacter sp. L3T2-6]